MFTILAITAAATLATATAAAFDATFKGRAVHAETFESMCGNSAWDGLKAGLGL